MRILVLYDDVDARSITWPDSQYCSIMGNLNWFISQKLMKKLFFPPKVRILYWSFWERKKEYFTLAAQVTCVTEKECTGLSCNVRVWRKSEICEIDVKVRCSTTWMDECLEKFRLRLSVPLYGSHLRKWRTKSRDWEQNTQINERMLHYICDPIQQKIHLVYFWKNWDFCII